MLDQSKDIALMCQERCEDDVVSMLDDLLFLYCQISRCKDLNLITQSIVLRASSRDPDPAQHTPHFVVSSLASSHGRKAHVQVYRRRCRRTMTPTTVYLEPLTETGKWFMWLPGFPSASNNVWRCVSQGSASPCVRAVWIIS